MTIEVSQLQETTLVSRTVADLAVRNKCFSKIHAKFMFAIDGQSLLKLMLKSSGWK